jgi:hypothetical protein
VRNGESEGIRKKVFADETRQTVPLKALLLMLLVILAKGGPLFIAARVEK